jgi:hypothetical protein
MLVRTLDLSHWTAIMFTATEKTEQGITRLKQAHSILSDILDHDEKDLEEAEFHTRAVEAALKATNPHESWGNEPTPITGISLDDTCSSPSAMHPLLSRLNIEQAHKAAIEELSESITYIQTKANCAALEATGRGPAIPFLPARAVEDQMNTRSHHTWCLSNINLMAPITIPMWKIWVYLSDQEVKRCKERALNCQNMLREPIILSNAFPLSFFDHHKCNTTKIQVLAKQNVSTVNPRVKKYTSTSWNCQRSCIRCMCDRAAPTGYKGTMLWFDHTIWFILNNLERFFDSTYPTLAAKYGAFITWLNGTAKSAVCLQITFIAIRRMMEDASVEYSATPDGRLLAKYYKAPSARQVERFIKPAQFSIETLPNPGPTTNKRRKLNLNVPDNGDGFTQEQRPARSNAYSRYGHAQTSRGRDGYNKNYRYLSRSRITLLITSTSEGAKTLVNVEAGNLSSVVITNLTYSDMLLMLASLLHYSRHEACPKRWSAKLLQAQELHQARFLLHRPSLPNPGPVPSKDVSWTGLISRLRISMFYNHCSINLCR